MDNRSILAKVVDLLTDMFIYLSGSHPPVPGGAGIAAIDHPNDEVRAKALIKAFYNKGITFNADDARQLAAQYQWDSASTQKFLGLVRQNGFKLAQTDENWGKRKAEEILESNL